MLPAPVQYGAARRDSKVGRRTMKVDGVDLVADAGAGRCSKSGKQPATP